MKGISALKIFEGFGDKVNTAYTLNNIGSLYNAQNNYLSFSVGSAITSLSIPENEYEECLLKAKAMFEVLEVK